MIGRWCAVGCALQGVICCPFSPFVRRFPAWISGGVGVWLAWDQIAAQGRKMGIRKAPPKRGGGYSVKVPCKPCQVQRRQIRLNRLEAYFPPLKSGFIKEIRTICFVLCAPGVNQFDGSFLGGAHVGVYDAFYGIEGIQYVVPFGAFNSVGVIFIAFFDGYCKICVFHDISLSAFSG